MVTNHIIVIGASAGGIPVLKELIESLPTDLNAVILIVLHVSPHVKSFLPGILSKKNVRTAMHAIDGEIMEGGKIYLAPPDHHMLIQKDKILVRRGPKENWARPSIDVLFRSAALHHGKRVTGIILSGVLNDGTSGMWAIKEFGGTTIVQDPNEAQFPAMTKNVLEFVSVDHIARVSEMATILNELVNTSDKAKKRFKKNHVGQLKTELVITSQYNTFDTDIITGRSTPLKCPECNNMLSSFHEGKLPRYKCINGHTFVANALLAGLTESAEENLWKIIKGHQDTAYNLEELAKKMNAGNTETWKQFATEAAETRKRLQQLNDFIIGGGERE